MIFLVVTLFYMAITCQQLHFYLFAGGALAKFSPIFASFQQKMPRKFFFRRPGGGAPAPPAPPLATPMRPAELRCRGTISVEQSSCCSTEMGDDSAHFQETTEGLSVPHLTCWRTERTFTTVRRCCGVFVILAPDTTSYVLTSERSPLS